jgi:hypothetical protein
MQVSRIFSLSSDAVPIFGSMQLLIANDTNRVRGAVLDLSQDGPAQILLKISVRIA